MRVTVFGATTELGRQVVADLLVRGHAVTACLTDRDQVPSDFGNGVRIVVGELTDVATVEEAVAAGEAVINALDPRTTRPEHPLVPVTTTAHIVGAMHRHGIRRYVGYTCPTIPLCPHERAPARVRAHRLHVSWFHSRTQEQVTQMARVVTASGLDWTLVRFLQLHTGDARAVEYVGHFGRRAVGTRATVAGIAATAAQALDTDHLRAAPAVST